MSKRIEEKFSELKKQNKTAFVAYICGGDPDYDTSAKILDEIANHADIIELGVPFSDPAGDGPTIETASKRAIKNGMTLQKTLDMAANFRTNNDSTPLILMGYYNSFLKYGLDNFFDSAKKSGIDGLIVVDLPLEERDEIINELQSSQISLINLISPLTDEDRIDQIVDKKYASGFLYLVSMLGITGTKNASAKDNQEILSKIKKHSDVPVVIGFGIKNPDIAKEFKAINPDGIVVGSAIVKEIADNYQNLNQEELVKKVSQITKEFNDAIKE